MSGLQIAGSERVEWVLDVLAQSIVRNSYDLDLVLIGMLRRGAPLARMLVERIEKLTGGDVPPLGEIRVERYSDELEVLHDQPMVDRDSLGVAVGARDVILVDDVVYTGRSLRAASSHLDEMGARSVRAAVLCSRSVRDPDVKPAFVGLQVEVGESSMVVVRVPPFDAEMSIVVRPKPEL